MFFFSPDLRLFVFMVRYLALHTAISHLTNVKLTVVYLTILCWMCHIYLNTKTYSHSFYFPYSLHSFNIHSSEWLCRASFRVFVLLLVRLFINIKRKSSSYVTSIEKYQNLATWGTHQKFMLSAAVWPKYVLSTTIFHWTFVHNLELDKFIAHNFQLS